MNAIKRLWLCALFGALALGAGGFIGYSDGRGDTQAEAAKHGAAEYVVGDDGRSVFRWKTVEEE